MFNNEDTTFSQYLTVEDLPERLRECVVPSGSLWFFHHPFYVTMFPTITPLPIEDILEKRKAYVEKCMEEGDYHGAVFGHERPYRADKFLQMREEGLFYSDDESAQVRLSKKYWELARSVWTDSENFGVTDHWGEILECDVPHRGFMTHSEDRRALRDMPDRLEIYRGIRITAEDDENDPEYAIEVIGCGGMSWTLDHDRARFFARRYARKGQEVSYILKTTVNKSDVIAYVTDRNESEIIMPSYHVEDYSYEAV